MSLINVGADVLTLEQVGPQHAAAVLSFERANREFFAGWIGDRDEQYFDDFQRIFEQLLDEQRTGASSFYVLVAQDGKVVGRFNLYEIRDGSADVGYRMSQEMTGRGIATQTLLSLCVIAAEQHNLRRLSAAARVSNHASRRVLEKAGFVDTGAVLLRSGQGRGYELSLERGA